MELKKIKEEVCKTCGAEVSSESRSYKHSNGFWNERRVFICGRGLHFHPNYMSIIITGECSKDGQEISKREKRETLTKKIANMILESNADQTFKDELLRVLMSNNVDTLF